MLYFKSVAILMHDITNNLAPLNISRLFNATDQVHACNTSSSSRSDYEIGYKTKQVVETSVTVNNNSPIRDYVHPDDQTHPLIFTLE